MGTDNDGETFEVIPKDEMFDESLLAAGVEITVAQWSAPAGRKDSIFSIAIKRR